MTRREPAGLRAGLLLTAAGAALHELRYLIAHGDPSGNVLNERGHAYMGLLTPAIAALLALALGRFVLRAAAPRAGGPAPERAIGWTAASAALALLFCAQESLEGLLASGHAPGLGAILAHGGWIALPLALGLGAVVAGLLRAERAALAEGSGLSAPRAPLLPGFPRILFGAVLAPSRLAPAGALGARGPPICLR